MEMKRESEGKRSCGENRLKDEDLDGVCLERFDGVALQLIATAGIA